MENKQLLEKLNRLGYPLLETSHGFDVNETLAEVVKSRDARYWEGFPVLLANAAKDESFNYLQVEKFLKDTTQKDDLKELYLVSLALYQFNKLHFDWTKKFENALTDKHKDKLKVLKGALNHGTNVKVGSSQLDSGRLKNAFQNYFTLEAKETKSMGDKQEEMAVEFALSQVFSSKQKDLFKKKLKGQPLTKTEREYFSRTVKRKVMALANSEVHRLAQYLLEH
jgi:hypothetical protein